MCLQMKENPPALHAMLNRTMNLPAAVCSQTDGRSLALENGRSLVSKPVDDLYAKDRKSGKKRLVSQKWKLDLQPCYDDANQMKTDKLGNQGYEDANVCTQAASLVNCLTESPWSGSSKTVDAVMSNCGVEAWFENVVNTDYMKLLELDDAVDEERYREAMEMPLSPTLPDIESHILGASGMPDSQYTIEQNFVGLESGKNSLVPFCTFHVVDVEGGSDWHMVNAPVNSFKEAGDDGHGFHDTVFAANACGLQIGESGAEMQVANQISIPERVGIEIPSASNGEHINERISKCCVVFSSTKDERSISKIVLSTITCIAQLSMASQKDWLVHKILLTLVMEDLLLGEKACVFFSVMLYNFSVVNLVDYENFSSGDSYSCADSFMVHIKTVMADAENRSIFSESFELDALVDLIEDFLIDGRVLVFSDVPSGAGWGTFLLDGMTMFLSHKSASVDQLSIILASLCHAVDYVSFICDASYTILRMCKYGSSLILRVLNMFAYLCGEKYFTLSNYNLIMTIIKSIVSHLEGGKESFSTVSYPQMNVTNGLGFPNVPNAHLLTKLFLWMKL